MGFSLFPAIYDRPQDICFAEQEKEEIIELLLRQHWVTNLGWIFTGFIGLALPLIFLSQTINLSLFMPLNVPAQIVFALAVLWYLFVVAFLIESFLYWYFNIYIVTNKHLIDIKFSSLLFKEVSESQLKDIENIYTTMQGIAGSLFNFGKVTVETAGKHKIEFVAIPRPDFVADRIQDLEEAAGGGGADAP